MKDPDGLEVVDPRQGDPPLGRHEGHRKADRWGARWLLMFNPQGVPQARKIATFVDTATFSEPQLFYLQVRFASVTFNMGTPVPVLPFQTFSSDAIQFTVKRQLDDYSGIVQDAYTVNGFAPSADQPFWMPIATVAARKLIILAEDIDDHPGHGAQYVDVVATRVTSIDSKLITSQRADSSDLFACNIFGWGRTQVARFAATTVVQTLASGNASRRQFIITNKGTTALALRFSDVDNPNLTPGAEDFDVLLAPGERYVSDQDGYWGEIRGIWAAGVAPTDYATVSTAVL